MPRRQVAVSLLAWLAFTKAPGHDTGCRRSVNVKTSTQHISAPIFTKQDKNNRGLDEKAGGCAIICEREDNQSDLPFLLVSISLNNQE
jgi:hypothetical protein